MSKPKIMLGVPSHDDVKAAFAFSLAPIALDLASRGIACGAYNLNGTCIEDSRNDIVEKALAENCTHIMWIDSDVKLPADLPRKLLERNLNIVGCTYRRRRGTYSFTHAELDGIDHTAPLRRCAYLPGGCLLVNTRVYKTIGDEGWYDRVKINGDKGHWGEDIAFSFRAVQAGYDIWLDEEQSRRIAHVGTFEFTAEGPDDAFLKAFGLVRQ